LPRRAISATTVGSARVVVSPSGRFSEASRSSLRMILPERVLGSSGVNTMLAGAANLPLTVPTWFRSSLIMAADPSWAPLGVANDEVASASRPDLLAIVVEDGSVDGRKGLGC